MRNDNSYIRDNDINVADTLLAPDFPIGGRLFTTVRQPKKYMKPDAAALKYGAYTLRQIAELH